MSRKVLGVLGGMGPLATAAFLQRVTLCTAAERDQDHLPMVIHCDPAIPDRSSWILGRTGENPAPAILKAGQALAGQGVHCIAMPCITAHCFHRELQSQLPVPLLDGVGETVRALQQAGIRRAGLLATDGTIRAGFFADALERGSVQPVLPKNQAAVMALIYGNLKTGRPPDTALFAKLLEELRENGAETVILGCTELSLLPPEDGCVDVLTVLARAAIRECGKDVKS